LTFFISSAGFPVASARSNSDLDDVAQRHFRAFTGRRAQVVVGADCISLLYTVWGFWSKNPPNAANAKLLKTLKTQGESTRVKAGLPPFLNYETVALPLSYIGFTKLQ
jgi:hypothetical protein